MFESICAMLNRNGEHIFLRVADDGTILGVDKNSVSKMKKISQIYAITKIN